MYVCRPIIKYLRIAITLASLAGPAALAESPTSQPYAGKPYNDKPIAIPGVVKATEYDIAPDAKNGVTFNYRSPVKATDLRTSKDGIGLARFGKGHMTLTGEAESPEQTYLGWTHSGEWVKYTLHVAESGRYVIGTHVSAAMKGGTLSFSFSPGVTKGPVEIPTTAGHRPGIEPYHVWERLDHLAEITLQPGDAVMTVTIEHGGGFNIESVTLTKSRSTP